MERLAAIIQEGVSSGKLATPQSIVNLVQAESARDSASEAEVLLNSCPSFQIDPGLHPSDVSARVAVYLTDFNPLKGLVPCHELPGEMGECFRVVPTAGELSTVISSLLQRHSEGFGEEYVSLQRIWNALDSVNGTRMICLKNKGESQMLKLKCKVFAEALRPDNLVCIDNWLFMYGEEKEDAKQFQQAKGSLLEKVSSLPVAVYGDVSFLICYAAAGPLLQFFMMQINPQKRPFLTQLTPELNLKTQRPYVVLVYIKLYFLLRAMRAAISSGPTYDLYTLVDRTTSSVQLSLEGACKVIRDWKDYCQEWGVDYKDMENAYTAARRSEKHLIGSVTGPKLMSFDIACKELSTPSGNGSGKSGSGSRKRKMNDKSKNNQDLTSYVVHTIPLLADREPRSEGELRQMVYGVLKALTALHGAGLVHRDIRPGNVMYNYKLRKYVLIDLEGVCKEGLVAEVEFRCWDENTLSEQGNKYTLESDLYLVGLLMKEYGHLLQSQDSQHLAASLLAKSYGNAAAALEHEWFCMSASFQVK